MASPARDDRRPAFGALARRINTMEQPSPHSSADRCPWHQLAIGPLGACVLCRREHLMPRSARWLSRVVAVAGLGTAVLGGVALERLRSPRSMAPPVVVAEPVRALAAPEAFPVAAVAGPAWGAPVAGWSPAPGAIAGGRVEAPAPAPAPAPARRAPVAEVAVAAEPEQEVYVGAAEGPTEEPAYGTVVYGRSLNETGARIVVVQMPAPAPAPTVPARGEGRFYTSGGRLWNAASPHATLPRPGLR